MQIGAAHAVAWNTSLTSEDYWNSWALAQFGPDVASAAASVFAAVESFNLPRPVSWSSGPGTMAPSNAQCSWAATYAFVDTMTSLRAELLTSISNGNADLAALERFDYWLQQFVYMRGIARMECDWAAYNAVIASVQGITNRQQQIAAAIALGFPARISLVANVTTMMNDLMATVSTTEGFGENTICGFSSITQVWSPCLSIIVFYRLLYMKGPFLTRLRNLWLALWVPGHLPFWLSWLASLFPLQHSCRWRTTHCARLSCRCPWYAPCWKPPSPCACARSS